MSMMCWLIQVYDKIGRVVFVSTLEWRGNLSRHQYKMDQANTLNTSRLENSRKIKKRNETFRNIALSEER